MTFSRFIQRLLPRTAIRAGTLGLAGQAVISGVNFLIMVALARTLGPAAFGLFALLFTVLGLLESIQASLITSPHTVISASKSGQEYRRYTSSVAILQGGLLAMIGACLALIGLIALQVNAGVGWMLLALAFASVGSQCQNFWKSVLFTESRYGGALLNDSVTHGLRLALVTLAWLTVGLTGAIFFLIIGVTCLIGATIGILQVRSSLTLAFGAVDRALIREHWNFGHWLFAGKIVSESPKYVTAAVLSSTLSVGAYGAFRAGSQLVGAANVPLKALNNILRPKLARDAQHGPGAVWQTLQPIVLLGTAAFTAFGIVLIVLREPLLSLVFGSDYATYTAVMFVLALLPVANLLKQVLSSAFLAFRRTRAIFTRSVLGAVTGSGLGSLTIYLFGLPAAGAVILLSSVVSILWLGFAWRRFMRNHDAEQANARQDIVEIGRGRHGSIELDTVSGIVCKQYLTDDAARIIQREGDYLGHFSVALASKPWVTCPEPVRIDTEQRKLWMTDCPGTSLDTMLKTGNGSVDDDLEHIATQIVVALQRYVSTFNEPYFDLTTANMLYDAPDRTLSLIDFTSTSYFAEALHQKPIECSLAKFIGGSMYQGVRPSTWNNHQSWKRRQRLLAAVLAQVQDQRDLDLGLIRELSQVVYQKNAKSGGRLHRLWHGTAGQLLFKRRLDTLLAHPAMNIQCDLMEYSQ